MGAILNGTVQGSRCPIYGQLSHGAHGTWDKFVFPVDFQHSSQSWPAIELFQDNSCIQQGIRNGKITEIEKAVLGIIDIDPEKMQGIQGSNLKYAQWGDSIWQLQLLRNVHNAINLVRMPYRNPSRWQGHDFCYIFTEVRGQGATAHQDNSLWRLLSVELQYLLADGLSQLVDIWLYRLDNLLGGHIVFHAHNIGKMALEAVGGIPL